jgi:hypothetical protein
MGRAAWLTTDHVALVVSIAALVATAITFYYEASATSSIVSARAAEESVKVAEDLLKIEQDRDHDDYGIPWTVLAVIGLRTHQGIATTLRQAVQQQRQ